MTTENCQCCQCTADIIDSALHGHANSHTKNASSEHSHKSQHFRRMYKWTQSTLSRSRFRSINRKRRSSLYLRVVHYYKVRHCDRRVVQLSSLAVMMEMPRCVMWCTWQISLRIKHLATESDTYRHRERSSTRHIGRYSTSHRAAREGHASR